MVDGLAPISLNVGVKWNSALCLQVELLRPYRHFPSRRLGPTNLKQFKARNLRGISSSFSTLPPIKNNISMVFYFRVVPCTEPGKGMGSKPSTKPVDAGLGIEERQAMRDEG